MEKPEDLTTGLVLENCPCPRRSLPSLPWRLAVLGVLMLLCGAVLYQMCCRAKGGRADHDALDPGTCTPSFIPSRPMQSTMRRRPVKEHTYNPRMIAARGLDRSKDRNWGLRVWGGGGVGFAPVSSLSKSPALLSDRKLHVRYIRCRYVYSTHVRTDGAGQTGSLSCMYMHVCSWIRKNYSSRQNWVDDRSR